MADVGWENAQLVPLVWDDAPAASTRAAQTAFLHPLFPALRVYRRTLKRLSPVPLPRHVGRVQWAEGYPYVAFSSEDWHRACRVMRVTGAVALGRTVIPHRAQAHQAIQDGGQWRFRRRALDVTHVTLQVAAALPRLPMDARGYFRVRVLRTPPLRVVNDRLAGGRQLIAAYSDLFWTLAQMIETEGVPDAVVDVMRRPGST